MPKRCGHILLADIVPESVAVPARCRILNDNWAASLMQKLITIMEHKVWLSGQIVNDKSVLPSSTSYVWKASLALALSDHADNH